MSHKSMTMSISICRPMYIDLDNNYNIINLQGT